MTRSARGSVPSASAVTGRGGPPGIPRGEGYLLGMHVLLHLAAIAATILVLSRLLPGVRIRNVNTAVLVAIVFSLLNFFLGWAVSAAIHVVLFLPAIFTLGLLYLIVPFLVNAVMLWLTDKAMKSFEVQTMRALLLSAGALTIVNYFFSHPTAVHSFCTACQGGGHWT